MLIEIHMIQNHSPANLNRDDLGAPKTCIFGGVTRARISSQCLKRSIRRSDEFAAALEQAGGVRTRRLANVLACIAASKKFDHTPEQLDALLAKNENGFDDKLAALAGEALELGGVKPKGKSKAKEDRPGTDHEDGGDKALSKMLVFLSTSTIGKMARDLADAKHGKELAEKYKPYIAEKPCVPDIALCGRMTEVAKNSIFSDLNFTVEAALSAAHAISTHAVVNEVDYFTAADDIPGSDAGAAHVNEAMFNSACFYKYFCLDWDQLVKNLAGPEPSKKDADAHNKWTNEIKAQAERLAACTLGHFIRAAAMTAPSGKQNSFASHTEPCGILIEIKKNGKHPTNYANAFAEPVERIGKPDDDAPDERSIEGRSVACLADHVQAIRKAYGIESNLLWYSPKLWRFPLQYWERNGDGKKEAPKLVTDKRYDILGGDAQPGFVEAVIEAIGLKWDGVKNAGKAAPAGAAS